MLPLLRVKIISSYFHRRRMVGGGVLSNGLRVGLKGFIQVKFEITWAILIKKDDDIKSGELR